MNDTTSGTPEHETDFDTALPSTKNLLTLGGRCFFKNAIVYKLPADFEISVAELESYLIANQLTTCGPLEKERIGWVNSSPLGRTVHAVSGQYLIALGEHKKLLPASMIHEEVVRRLAVLADEQGFPVGRKQKREIKAQVKTELLAKAPVRTTATRAWIDTVNQWMVVEASGFARAERVVDALRDALGTFAVTLIEADPSPQSAMASWLNDSVAPEGFSFDTDLELKSSDKATIRYTNHPLDGEDIKKHLQEGKFVNRLGLTWDDRVSFILTSNLELKRIKYLELEAGKEEQDSEQAPSAEEIFDADLTLMSSELSDMLAALCAAFEIKND